jgi:uncharacterized protein YggE
MPSASDETVEGGPTRGITVTGRGRAGAAADVFVLLVAAEVTSLRASEAASRAADALDRMRSAAIAHGVALEQLATQGIVLRQGYDHEGRPRGMVCELGLSIRSSEVARAGELVSACIEAGGDAARLQGVSFEHSDPSALMVLARGAAFTDARARASQLAVLAGRELGVVQQVVEGGAGPVPMAGDLALGKPMAFSPIPVDAGSSDAEVAVTVRWAWA